MNLSTLEVLARLAERSNFGIPSTAFGRG